MKLCTHSVFAPQVSERAQQALASQALGLAVCSAFARLPSLASNPELIEKVPLLVGILRENITCTSGSLPGGVSVEPAAAAIVDALECLLGVLVHPNPSLLLGFTTTGTFKRSCSGFKVQRYPCKCLCSVQRAIKNNTLYRPLS